MIKFDSMDITVKISEAKKELKEAEAKKQEFHDRAIILRRKIGKLETALENLQEILTEKPDEQPESSSETLKEVTENLK